MEKIPFKDLPDTSTPYNAATFNTMQDNIEEAINEGNKILVWKNESTSSNFGAQVIDVDLSNCNAITIVFANHNILNFYFVRGENEEILNLNIRVLEFDIVTTPYISFYERKFSLTNTTISFQDCVSLEVANGGTMTYRGQSNSSLRPLYIYKYTIDTGE